MSVFTNIYFLIEGIKFTEKLLFFNVKNNGIVTQNKTICDNSIYFFLLYRNGVKKLSTIQSGNLFNIFFYLWKLIMTVIYRGIFMYGCSAFMEEYPFDLSVYEDFKK